jgi:hypothetical protein
MQVRTLTPTANSSPVRKRTFAGRILTDNSYVPKPIASAILIGIRSVMRPTFDGITNASAYVRQTTPKTIESHDLVKTVDRELAIRSAKPTFLIAAPRTRPLNTSQNAADRKPAKTVLVGVERNTVSAAKNRSAVRYSGKALVAQRRMAMAANQPG